MRRLALIAALALLPLSSQAATYRLGKLEAGQPWSRPAVAGTNGVGYVTLTNRGTAADALVRIESPLAARVEMHRSTMTGNVMSMQKQATVALPAGGEVVFGPGGYHLMLIGLTRTLKAGDEIPATLTFASGATVKIAFAVSDGMGPPKGGAAADPMAGMAGMKH